MNYGEYYRKLKENPEEAKIYKAKHIPKKLYKYMSLGDSYQEKVSNLLNNKLWLSTSESLNDPFEYHNLFLNTAVLQEHGWSFDNIREYQRLYKIFRNCSLIGSFTSTVNSNMPLWAHYANNHKGICIEYEVENNLQIYPVTYETQRIDATTSIVNVINRTLQKSRGDTHDDDFFIMYFQFCMKHYSWKYEEEYRAVIPRSTYLGTGENVELSEIGLKITAIYLGYDINDKHKRDMIGIGQKLGIDVFEMGVNYESIDFQLIRKKIDKNEKIV